MFPFCVAIIYSFYTLKRHSQFYSNVVFALEIIFLGKLKETSMYMYDKMLCISVILKMPENFLQCNKGNILGLNSSQT